MFAAASVVVSCLAVGTLASTTTHLDSLELKSYDFLMTVARGPRPPPEDMVIVAIDESSIKEIGTSFQWPWPRSIHGELIRQLGAAGARAIVFDVVFDLPSDPAEDAELASAIRTSPAPVVLAATTEDVTDRQFHLTQQLTPLPMFIDAGAHPGSAAIRKDVDDKLRRAPLEAGGIPALAPAALSAIGRTVQRQSVPTLERNGAEDFLVDFAGPSRTIRTVSYYQALDAARSLPSGIFTGKTVFIGRSLTVQDIAQGAGRQDLYATPFDALMPGVEVHANAMNTLEHRLFIRRASTEVTWWLLLAVGGLIAAVMTTVRRLRTKVLVAGLLILLTPVVSLVAFLAVQYWLYTVQPLLVALSVFGLNALFQYRVSERERAFVKKALTGYVSKQVMQRLLDNPSALQLGGVQVNATVLFIDIVGFSSIAEKTGPRELLAILNEYFTRIGDTVMAQDGMIDKYIGDAVMAVWGATLPDERHASKACSAALAMKRSIVEAGGPLSARIGINTGVMMAGNLGHRERMEYTVIGDSVNLASRLEGAGKAYGTAILVSETTQLAAAAAFIFRRVDRIRVVGKQQPVAIYELLAARGEPHAEDEAARATSFERIVNAYESRDWTAALDAVREHRLEYPGADKTVSLYEERSSRFAAAPPAPDWDGVYTFSAK
ncbi:MAG: adenylate/guanylate cyclase domain-containing protein [Acidobacteriota bacterium]